jgi:hypothetical protein
MHATNPAVTAPYPIRVEGHLEQPSRWSWTVKWLLALPHAVVLAGLWVGHPPVTWSPRRIAAAVLTSLTALLGIAAIVAGGAALVLDQTQRNPGGYITTTAAPYSTGTYALESDSYQAGTAAEWSLARGLLGTIRIHSVSSRPVFIGIAPANAANQYLANVAHAEAADLGAQRSDFHAQPGGAPSALPAAQGFWAAHASGAGEQTLTWKVRGGNWRVIVMNASATRDVTTQLSIGASFPHLQIIGTAAVGAGLLLLLLSGSALYVVVRRRR